MTRRPPLVDKHFAASPFTQRTWIALEQRGIPYIYKVRLLNSLNSKLGCDKHRHVREDELTAVCFSNCRRLRRLRSSLMGPFLLQMIYYRFCSSLMAGSSRAACLVLSTLKKVSLHIVAYIQHFQPVNSECHSQPIQLSHRYGRRTLSIDLESASGWTGSVGLVYLPSCVSYDQERKASRKHLPSTCAKSSICSLRRSVLYSAVLALYRFP